MVELELAERIRRGEEVVLATVVRLDGRPPSRPGAKALIGEGRLLAGTLGCSEFDSQARDAAAEAIRSGVPGLRTFTHDLGSIEVYLEPHLSPPLLLVFGDTPLAGHLLRWAPELGYRASAEVPETAGPELCAVFTDHDDPALVGELRRVLALRPLYVGLVGSRRHTGHHLEALRGQGLAEDSIAAIQSPVGLDLGARTPAEIAISILAGLVALRRGGGAGWKDRPPTVR